MQIYSVEYIVAANSNQSQYFCIFKHLLFICVETHKIFSAFFFQTYYMLLLPALYWSYQNFLLLSNGNLIPVDEPLYTSCLLILSLSSRCSLLLTFVCDLTYIPHVSDIMQGWSLYTCHTSLCIVIPMLIQMRGANFWYS